MLLAIVFMQLSCYCDGSCLWCFLALVLGECPKACSMLVGRIALEQLLVGECSKLSPVNSDTASGFVLFCSVSFCFVVGFMACQSIAWFINKTAIYII